MSKFAWYCSALLMATSCGISQEKVEKPTCLSEWKTTKQMIPIHRVNVMVDVISKNSVSVNGSSLRSVDDFVEILAASGEEMADIDLLFSVKDCRTAQIIYDRIKKLNVCKRNQCLFASAWAYQE